MPYIWFRGQSRIWEEAMVALSGSLLSENFLSLSVALVTPRSDFWFLLKPIMLWVFYWSSIGSTLCGTDFGLHSPNGTNPKLFLFPKYLLPSTVYWLVFTLELLFFWILSRVYSCDMWEIWVCRSYCTTLEVEAQLLSLSTLKISFHSLLASVISVGSFC